MSNSFEATVENLPQKFIHQIMKPAFDTISYTRNGLISIKHNDVNIVIHCVKTNDVLPIESLNNTSCNKTTYYMIVNLAEYFINIHELENIDPNIQLDFLHTIQQIQLYVTMVLNISYHPKKFMIEKLDFSD